METIYFLGTFIWPILLGLAIILYDRNVYRNYPNDKHKRIIFSPFAVIPVAFIAILTTLVWPVCVFGAIVGVFLWTLYEKIVFGKVTIFKTIKELFK